MKTIYIAAMTEQAKASSLKREENVHRSTQKLKVTRQKREVRREERERETEKGKKSRIKERLNPGIILGLTRLSARPHAPLQYIFLSLI